MTVLHILDGNTGKFVSVDVFELADGTVAASTVFRPDCTGAEQSILVTLSATPWAVSSVDVPAFATRAMITAATEQTRYCLNKPPGGAPSGTATDGATLAANEVRVIGLAPGTSRTLQIDSSKASGTVLIQWFA